MRRAALEGCATLHPGRPAAPDERCGRPAVLHSPPARLYCVHVSTVQCSVHCRLSRRTAPQSPTATVAATSQLGPRTALHCTALHCTVHTHCTESLTWDPVSWKWLRWDTLLPPPPPAGGSGTHWVPHRVLGVAGHHSPLPPGPAPGAPGGSPAHCARDNYTVTVYSSALLASACQLMIAALHCTALH
jgi:hypothetical protein